MVRRAPHSRFAAPSGNLLVPIATVASVPRLLADAGVSVEKTALAVRLDPSMFDDPTRTISFSQVGSLLAECVSATQDETFPLRLGLAQGLMALNAVGYLAQHSTDVRAAFETIREHVHHFAGTIVVSEEKGLVSLDYNFLLPRIQGAGLIAEAGMGIAVSILRQLCGPDWSPVVLRLKRTLPQQTTLWQQCVRAPVQFGSERNQVTFSAIWLDHRLERANPELRRLLLDRVAELDAESSTGFPVQVCSVIRASLLVGDASIRNVASRFYLSPRTLRRRLSAQDATFEALLKKTRFDVACHLLENSTTSMTQIAGLLGYANSSAFSRAFRQWANTSPREWRTAQRANRHRTALEPRR